MARMIGVNAVAVVLILATIVFCASSVRAQTGILKSPAHSMAKTASTRTPVHDERKIPRRDSIPKNRAESHDSAPAGKNQSPFADLNFSSNRGPINIQADSLSLDYKKNSVTFNGHVHAAQAGGELYSDRLQLKYGKDFHQVEEMIADGDVRMTRGTQWATSDHAVLNEREHTVILTGNPVVHDANDRIAGSKITVYLQTGKSVVEGAKAVIFPRTSQNRDNDVGAGNAR